MSLETTKNDTQPKFKRNRKKNKFLRNAKGFGKKGSFGRGTVIDDDQYNYFINILDLMRNGFDDTEDKVNMANNVFEQTKGKEVHLACNQIVCKAMESLLGFVDAQHLESYFKLFGDDIRPICSDPFASHVLQKMIEIAFLRYVRKDQQQKDNDTHNDNEEPLAKKLKMDKKVISEEDFNLENNFTQEHKENCGKFILRVGKFMLNNMEDFVWDIYANHIMRTCILSLSGNHITKVAFKKGGAVMAKNCKIYEVPSEWHDVTKEYAQRLQMWPQFNSFPYQEHCSALLSVLCIALKVIDKKMLKHFGTKILMESLLKGNTDDEKLKEIENSDDEDKNTENGTNDNSPNKTSNKLPKVFDCQASIILLETLITVAGPKLFKKIYDTLFVNNLSLLAKQPLTHFSVHKLLDNIKQKNDFESVFEELQEHIEELLKIGHTGVIFSISAACLRLKTKQANLIAALQSALHLNDNKEQMKSFFLCLVKLKPFEIIQEDNSNFVHLHGSLIIQDILRFNKPIFLVKCILETKPDYLVAVFNTPNGSHICDAFLQSTFIGEKSREKLLNHLKGFYVDMAITKFGSRVVESCIASAAEAQKVKIVKELSEKLNMLKSSSFGKLINQKLRVDVYRLSPEQWKASFQKTESKIQQLFKDIIN